MRWLIYSLSLLAPLIAPAQGNFPFPEPEAEWHVTEVNPILGPDDAFAKWQYTTTGDTTVIQDTVYTTVFARGTCHSDQSTGFQWEGYEPPEFAAVGGLRTEGDTVFFRRFSHPQFTGRPTSLWTYPVGQEVILYDYSLQKGESFQYLNGNVTYTVEEVTETNDGRKQLSLFMNSDCGFPASMTWTEGRGCSRGLLETISMCFYAGSCYRSVQTPETCDLPCEPGDPILVALDPADAVAQTTLITPNPARDYMELVLPDESLVRMDLINANGQCVLSTPRLKNGNQVDVSALPSGWYLVRFIDAEGTIRWQQMLIQR